MRDSDTSPAAFTPGNATTAADFEARLVRLYGPVLGGQVLAHVLGYPTPGAFAKARQRGRLPIPTFPIPGRRGRFAATADLAAWLWRKRSGD